jgi:hypothetical protein
MNSQMVDDHPARASRIELHCGLALVYVPAGCVQRDAAGVPLQHQDRICGAGEAMTARNSVEGVVGIHFAGVVNQNDCDAVIMREPVQRKRPFDPTFRAGCR